MRIGDRRLARSSRENQAAAPRCAPVLASQESFCGALSRKSSLSPLWMAVSRTLSVVLICACLVVGTRNAVAAETRGYGADLEASAGLGVLTTRSGTDSVVVLGAQARLRLAFLELGGFVERAQVTPNTTSTVGALAGVWLPRKNGIDLDFALGVAERRYIHTQGGPGSAYELSTPALTAHASFSDRNGSVIGERVGARLALSWDLHVHERTYERVAVRHDVVVGQETDLPPPTVTVSSRSIGGVTVVLVLTLALDVAR